MQILNGKAVKLLVGQNEPLCIEADGKGIPSDLLAECFDGKDSTGKSRAIKG